MKLMLLGFSLLAVALTALAQPNPDMLWTRWYGGSSTDQANCIQQTSDGGYVIAGYTYSYGEGSCDVYVVKIASSGDTLWSRTYGGGNVDQGLFIQQTTDGGYVLAGITSSFGAGSYDGYVIKTNSVGDTLWTRTYGGSAYDKATCIQQTSDGGYVIAGYTYSFGAGSSDMYMVKTNSSGDALWSRTFGGVNAETATFIQQTADGGYVLVGTTTSFGAGGYDTYVIKTNSTGDTLWTRTYGGSGTDQALCIQQTSDGGYILAGFYSAQGSGNIDVYVLRINSVGNTLWTRTYGGSGTDGAYSIQETTDGGFVMAGSTSSFGAGSNDLYLLKINSVGDTLWTRTYGGIGNDYGYCGKVTTDGGYVIAGSNSLAGAGANDMWVVKTGPDTPCLNLTPPAPQIVITVAGNDAWLNWNRITQSIAGCPITVSQYLVFISAAEAGPYLFNGYTSDTTYTHVEAVRWTSRMFYQVVAHVGAIGTLTEIPRGTPQAEVMEILGR